MIEYAVLKVLWWMIIGMVLIVYACTAGFDIGVTMYMPFLKSEQDRRLILNTSAPTWDGNLTWIVFAGGGLFVVWPAVYSMAFSGLYVAFLIILYSMFLRPPGYEYRNKIDSHLWRRVWDCALFISGVIPVFIFGVALANCFVGFPFYFEVHTFREFYTGGFLQLLSPFTIMAGCLSVFMVLMHGSVYLQRRTQGQIHALAFKVQCITASIVMILLTIIGYYLMTKIKGFTLIASAIDPTQNPFKNVVTSSVGAWVNSYYQYPWKFFGPIVAYFGVFFSIFFSYIKWAATAFWASCFAIGGIVASAGFTLFPFIMPSSTNMKQSITLWNSTSNQYSLNVMLYIGVVLFILILGYKIFAYHTIWAKHPVLTHEDIKKNNHIFY